MIRIILLGSHFKGQKLIVTLTFIILTCRLIIFNQENFFIFFVAFEIRVLPILLIILVGGKSPFRGEAAFYLLSFTIRSSLLFLFRLMYLLRIGDYSINGIENFSWEKTGDLNVFLFSLFLTLTFFIKFPIFFFHIWLPKAHVEAPTIGSIILAAILLKLGGMGIFLFQKIFFSSLIFFEVISLFSLWGGM
jgi:NADH:ubiquinone oxidoreductase subunit 4 (subunit M)